MLVGHRPHRERDDGAERLTQEQSVLLGAIQQLRRDEVRGGADSSKTRLAVDQARATTHTNVASASDGRLTFARSRA